MYIDKCLCSYWITGWEEKYFRIIIERSFPQWRLLCLQIDKARQSQKFHPQSPTISKAWRLSLLGDSLFSLLLWSVHFHRGCYYPSAVAKKKKKKSFDWLTAPPLCKKENVECTSTLRFSACVNGNLVSETMGRVSLLNFDSDKQHITEDLDRGLSRAHWHRWKTGERYALYNLEHRALNQEN